MVSRAKLYRQLDALELELAEQLSAHLGVAAAGDNDFIFCVAEFSSTAGVNDQPDRTTEQLIVLSRRILALHEKLGESSQGTPAERLCWYCQQWSRETDPREKLARSLARQFLAEIQLGD